MSRILIADDHDLVRDMLSAFLQREGGFEIELAENFNAAAMAIKVGAPFDLILLDYNMPGMNGLEGLARARELAGSTPVALISGEATKSVASEALAAGAAGFLPKTMAAKSLTNAIRFMLSGEQYAPLDFMTAADPVNDNPVIAKLSTREKDVLRGLCKGQSNKEIARDLDLQEVTIKLHVKTLCRKLDAKNRTHAAMVARDLAFS